MFCVQHMALAQDKLTAHCSPPRPPPPPYFNIARKSSSPPGCPRSLLWTPQASHPCCFLRVCVRWVLPRFMLLFFGSLELLICFLSSLPVLLWLPDLDLIFDMVVGANHTTGTCVLHSSPSCPAPTRRASSQSPPAEVKPRVATRSGVRNGALHCDPMVPETKHRKML